MRNRTILNLQVTDVGTVFDVKRSDGSTRVAVSEGAVVLDPVPAAVRLDAVQAALVAGGRIRGGRSER